MRTRRQRSCLQRSGGAECRGVRGGRLLPWMEPVLTRGPWKSWKSPFLVTCAQVQFLTQSLGPGTCTLTHMLCPHTHTHMHVSHMHVFTCMLMPSHVCMHVQCTGACIHKSTCGHTIHTCMDMCTCKHVYTCTHACTCEHV